MAATQISFLLVDDEINLREALAGHLRELGFTGLFYEASNGEDALAILEKNKARQERVEFVICDVMMPKMNGLEFLRKMKSEKSFENIPVLMLTSKEDRKIVMESLENGAAHYLVKPWNKQALAEKIQYCLDKFGMA